MTMVVPCDVCGKPYRVSDLSTIRIEPPHYEDLPEPNARNHVDIVDENHPTRRVIRLHYCEMCLDGVELPPLRVESDPDVAPEVYEP